METPTAGVAPLLVDCVRHVKRAPSWVETDAGCSIWKLQVEQWSLKFVRTLAGVIVGDGHRDSNGAESHRKHTLQPVAEKDGVGAERSGALEVRKLERINCVH
jgi:hypothetical protein